MNYTLQLHGERMLYPVPSGLYELMSDISREVLRDQPTMLYNYIAHYLETLVKVREYSRTAEAVVEDVIDHNQGLLAFVDSLGVSFAEADTAARRIQRAFRTFLARKRLLSKTFVESDRFKGISFSASFQDFLETLDVDLDKAERASEVIQNAYRTYRSRKEFQERKFSRDASTHTVDVIPLRYPYRKRTPLERDSRLLVYQQSPRHSVESTWSSLARDVAEKEGTWKPPVRKASEPFVYKRTDHVWEQKKKSLLIPAVSALSNIPEEKMSLPYYYDDTQPKIPMISESGLLLKEEHTDIVTLFSTDSVDDEFKHKFGSQSDVKLPSLDSLTTGPKAKSEDLARELFDIIAPRSTASRSTPPRTTSEPAPQVARTASAQMEQDGSLHVIHKQSLARSVSKASAPGSRAGSRASLTRSAKSGSTVRLHSQKEIEEEAPSP